MFQTFISRHHSNFFSDKLVLTSVTPASSAPVLQTPKATSSTLYFYFSSRSRHTRCLSDWSSDVCSSDLTRGETRSGPQCITCTTCPQPSESHQGNAETNRGEPRFHFFRSEERRVGKECSDRWTINHCNSGMVDVIQMDASVSAEINSCSV